MKTPKPIAHVSWSADSYSGRVFIETPDTDADGAHRAEAVRAALAASDGWGAAEATRRRGATVRLSCPRDLREAAKHATQDARDAAKAALRALGYTVRAT